jgi:hypothetical protein
MNEVFLVCLASFYYYGALEWNEQWVSRQKGITFHSNEPNQKRTANDLRIISSLLFLRFQVNSVVCSIVISKIGLSFRAQCYFSIKSHINDVWHCRDKNHFFSCSSMPSSNKNRFVHATSAITLYLLSKKKSANLEDHLDAIKRPPVENVENGTDYNWFLSGQIEKTGWFPELHAEMKA